MTTGKRIYGPWAGAPKGRKEDMQKCIVEVSDGGPWPSYHQCLKPRGKGPDGLYCGLHAKQIAAGRFPRMPESNDA